METDPTLDVDTWVERALLDRLTAHDRRHEYDQRGVDRTTDDLVAACAQLDALAAGDGTGLPALDEVMQREIELEATVEEALEALEERGFVEHVGERHRAEPLLGDTEADARTTAVWEPTVEGRAQARALREAYSTAIDEVIAEYVEESETPIDDRNRSDGEPLASLPDNLPDECTREMVAVAQRYGILPW